MDFNTRQELRNVHFLRSTYYFWHTLRVRLSSSKESLREEFVDLLQEREDPWSYTTNPEENDRFESALELLDIAGKELFENAFEVACSEGVFSSMLAGRCKSLLAVDISEAALSRAKERCGGKKVRFEQWDLFASPVLKDLDLL